jgi:hypothetical protein
MKGRILGYDSENSEGAIQGADGNRYSFQLAEWKGEDAPRPEMAVDFVPDGGVALKIYPIRDSEAEENKLVLSIISLLITFFLGFIGTLVSRLAMAKQPLSKVILPVAIHAIITLFFFFPVFGWVIYVVCTIYFMVKNYQIINRGRNFI